MSKWLEYLIGNGASVENPATVQRHDPPDLTQTDIYKAHLEKKADAEFLQEQADLARRDIEARFKAQEPPHIDYSQGMDSHNASPYEIAMRAIRYMEEHGKSSVSRPIVTDLAGKLPLEYNHKIMGVFNSRHFDRDLEKLDRSGFNGLLTDDLQKSDGGSWWYKRSNDNNKHASVSSRSNDSFESILTDHYVSGGEQSYSRANVKGWSDGGRELIRNAVRGNANTVYKDIARSHYPPDVRQLAEDLLNKKVTLAEETVKDINKWADHDDSDLYIGVTHLKHGSFDDNNGDDVQMPPSKPRSWWE